MREKIQVQTEHLRSMSKSMKNLTALLNSIDNEISHRIHTMPLEGQVRFQVDNLWSMEHRRVQTMRDHAAKMVALLEKTAHDFEVADGRGAGQALSAALKKATDGINGSPQTILGQACLSVMGFPNGSAGANHNGVDGKWGRKDKAATKLFQLMMGLPQTGELDKITAAKLNECANTKQSFRELVEDAYKRGIRPQIMSESSQAERVNSLYFYAVIDEKATGVPAAITVAQAIEESGAGARIPTDKYNNTYSYNLFGIKADKAWLNEGNPYVASDTGEHVKGTDIRIEAKFRAYDGYLESVNDHSKFLTDNQRYNELFDLPKDDQLLENWVVGLHQCGYATNPSYASNLESHIKSYGLK